MKPSLNYPDWKAARDRRTAFVNGLASWLLILGSIGALVMLLRAC